MTAHKTTICIADDDPQMLRLMARNLELEGYSTATATNGLDALTVIKDTPPDAVLLDVMMPKMDGFAVCQQVRTFSNVPIIIVTARGQDQDKVRGLDLGADDYLTKPFSVDELLARVRAVLRRGDFRIDTSTQQTELTVGGLVIDFAQHIVTRDGAEVTLTPTEYNLLAYFGHNVGRVLTQRMLLEHVCGNEYSNEYHMLQVNINRLRRKIEADPSHPRYLITKSGVGYQLAIS